VDARTAIDLPIDIDGRRVRSETLHGSLSPYVLTIGTTLPAHGASVYSTYHGHPGAVSVAVHLSRTPGHDARTDVCEHYESLMPVVFARARCLRDHALRVGDTLALLGHHHAVHLSDAAEVAVETGRIALGQRV
jgi:hypothetical protein